MQGQPPTIVRPELELEGSGVDSFACGIVMNPDSRCRCWKRSGGAEIFFSFWMEQMWESGGLIKSRLQNVFCPLPDAFASRIQRSTACAYVHIGHKQHCVDRCGPNMHTHTQHGGTKQEIEAYSSSTVAPAAKEAKRSHTLPSHSQKHRKKRGAK